MPLQTTTYQQSIVLKNYGVLPLGYFCWLSEKHSEVPPILVPTSTLETSFNSFNPQIVTPAFTLCEMLALQSHIMIYIDSRLDYFNHVFEKLTQQIFESPEYLQSINDKLLNNQN